MTETGWWILLSLMLLLLGASFVRFDVWWTLLRGWLQAPWRAPGSDDVRPDRDDPAHGAPHPRRRGHHPVPHHHRTVFHRSGRRG